MYIPPGRYRTAARSPARWPLHHYRPCWPGPPNMNCKPFSSFEMEKQKIINPFVSKCYRCRYSLTDTGTTVQSKGSKGKYEQ